MFVFWKPTKKEVKEKTSDSSPHPLPKHAPLQIIWSLIQTKMEMALNLL